jgi:3-deoxy-manno-octulosonate cytidylyltransferase (CMP-KDO synthetase)
LDFSEAKNTGDAGHRRVFLTPRKFKRYIGKCRSYSLGVTKSGRFEYIAKFPPFFQHRMHKNNKTLGIIPARYASTRFPGKPLVDILGKSMIQRVYEQVQNAKLIDEVVVATDDKRIFEHVNEFGGNVIMTQSTHQSGTDRCAEVIEDQRFNDFEVVVNIQGDEPFINPNQIDLAVDFLNNNEEFDTTTLAKRIDEVEHLFNPNIVKVVFGQNRKALYFSRHPIPFHRNVLQEKWLEQGRFFKHIGLYVFRKSILQKIAKLPSSTLEKAESLEQLRWLDNDFSIGIEITNLETIGIDTQEDLKKVDSKFINK